MGTRLTENIRVLLEAENKNHLRLGVLNHIFEAIKTVFCMNQQMLASLAICLSCNWAVIAAYVVFRRNYSLACHQCAEFHQGKIYP